MHFLIFLPGTFKSVDLSPLSRIHGLRSLDHQKKRMLRFVRRCRRSASLATQRLLGIRLSHVQSVARLRSRDQQNNLVTIGSFADESWCPTEPSSALLPHLQSSPLTFVSLPAPRVSFQRYHVSQP